MTLEHRLVIGREEILRPPPRPFAFDHRVDGDVADSELFHLCLSLLRAQDAAQRVALAKRCAAEAMSAFTRVFDALWPRLPAARRNRGPGSAKQRFAKSYALRRARDTDLSPPPSLPAAPRPRSWNCAAPMKCGRCARSARR